MNENNQNDKFLFANIVFKFGMNFAKNENN